MLYRVHYSIVRMLFVLNATLFGNRKKVILFVRITKTAIAVFAGCCIIDYNEICQVK